MTHGVVFDEVTYRFGQQHSLKVRLYHEPSATTAGSVELLFGLGLVPENTEILVVIATDLDDTASFKTDDNGFETLHRVTNNSQPMENNVQLF